MCTTLCSVKSSYSINVYLNNVNGIECPLKLKVIWGRISEKSQAVVFFPPNMTFTFQKPIAREKSPA